MNIRPKLVSLTHFVSFVIAAGCFTGAVACGGESGSIDDSPAADEGELNRRAARFEIFQGLDDEFRFNVVALNGEAVLRSEGYASKQKAQQGVDSIKANAPDESKYDVRETRDDRFYFNLKAANGEVIGTSEIYSTRANAQRGADTVRQLVRDANRVAAVDARREPRWETFKGLDDQHYFHLRAGNGEIVLRSEGYSTRDKMLSGITGLENIRYTEAFEVLETLDTRFAFHVKAQNGEIMAQGQAYSTKAHAERAVEVTFDLLRERSLPIRTAN
jgi:uncharacterized protein YegP (UPF0339 family)